MTVPNTHNGEPIRARGDGPGFLLSPTVAAEILAEGAGYRAALEQELRRIDGQPTSWPDRPSTDPMGS